MQDLTERKRDKLTAIISKAHSRLQGVLVEAGIDPAVARAIAATRIHQLLPAGVRQQLTAAESAIAVRVATLAGNVMAADAKTIDAIPFE